MTSEQQPGRGPNLWIWFAPAILAVVVIANAWVIYLAVTTDDSLVHEDWYERSLSQDPDEAAAPGEAPVAPEKPG
jgi:hypothetical protein